MGTTTDVTRGLQHLPYQACKKSAIMPHKKAKDLHFELESMKKEYSEEINMFPNWAAVWISFCLGFSFKGNPPDAEPLPYGMFYRWLGISDSCSCR